MVQAKQREKGGVVSFIIVGVVLLALLVGGIYLSKQQGRIASRGGVATNTPVPEKASEAKPDSTDEKKPATENKSSDSSTTQDKSSDKPAESSNNPSQQPSHSSQSQPAPSSVANTGPSHIASTGPDSFVVGALGLGALVGGVSFYRRSHAQLKRSALGSSL